MSDDKIEELCLSILCQQSQDLEEMIDIINKKWAEISDDTNLESSSDSESSADDSESSTTTLVSSTTSSSESSFDDSDVEEGPPSLKRRKLVRIKCYMETVERYDSGQFFEHFRMRRETMQIVVNLVRESVSLPVHASGREKISAERAVCMTVWYLANTETFRQISDRFDVTKSAAHTTIRRVMDCLVSKRSQYIKWPMGNRLQTVKDGFGRKHGFRAIGAVDGTHFKIMRPKEHVQVFCNRKQYTSIQAQAVCDHQKRFTDFVCGNPGSMHDSRCLRGSSLYRRGISNEFGDDYILGDSGYSCLSWLITPFRENRAYTDNHNTFNERHSSTRIVIEQAFGLLKGKFRRLQFFQNLDISIVVTCVVAAVVLHNICLDHNEPTEQFEAEGLLSMEGLEENSMARDEERLENVAKRNELFRQMFANR